MAYVERCERIVLILAAATVLDAEKRAEAGRVLNFTAFEVSELSAALAELNAAEMFAKRRAPGSLTGTRKKRKS